MITITLNDLLNSVPTFQEISRKPLKAKVAYRMARLIRELDKENSVFEESRQKIVEKYSEKDADGNVKTNEDGNILIQPGRAQECGREMQELLDTNIEINADKINMADIEEIELTPAQMLSIEAFVEE